MAHQSDLIESDIVSYLKAQEHKSLLRFITCGSVDDGKSTLIGRLLYESKLIYEDLYLKNEIEKAMQIQKVNFIQRAVKGEFTESEE